MFRETGAWLLYKVGQWDAEFKAALTSEVPDCSSGILTNVLPHLNAMPQTQDTTPRHSIQTRGRPVAVQSIDVERHARIHYYPCQCQCLESLFMISHAPINQFISTIKLEKLKLPM